MHVKLMECSVECGETSPELQAGRGLRGRGQERGMAWGKGRRGLGGTALWGRGLVGTGSWLEARPWGVAEPEGRGWSHIAWWEAWGGGGDWREVSHSSRAWPGGAWLRLPRVGSSSGWPARRTVPLVAAVAGCDQRPFGRTLPTLVATWRPCCALGTGLAPWD